MALDAQISDVPGLEKAAYITLSGDFDLRSADNFERFSRKLLHEERKRFFIMDVAGIGSCVPVAAQVLRDFCDNTRDAMGAVAVVSPSDTLMEVLTELDLTGAMPLFNDYKAAFEYLRKMRVDLKLAAASGDSLDLPTASGSGIHTLPSASSSGDYHAGDSTMFYSKLGPPKPKGQPIPLGPKTPLPGRAPGASAAASDTGLQFDAATGDATTVHARYSGPVSGAVPDAVPAGPAGIRMRAYDDSGTLHTSAGPTSLESPIERVLVIAPPDNEHVLKVFVDAVEQAGFKPEALFPLEDGAGWDEVVEIVRHAQLVLADFAPCRARVPDPNASVLTATALARVILGPERLFVMTSDRKLPPMWNDVMHDQYNDNRAQLRQMIPRLVDRLRRAVRAISGV